MPVKKIKVQYFAILKDECGCPQETVETSAGTAADLYEELSERHGFSLARKHLQVAINDRFASWDYRLADDDLVVFVPPVAGG